MADEPRTASTVHCYPVGDLVDHDTDGDECICGPTTEPVERDDGSIGWLVVHHSLDGREQREGWKP
jgi:hypothetical protein